MNKHHVTFEVVKLLKEKGFDFLKLEYRDSLTHEVVSNYLERLHYWGSEEEANLIRLPTIADVVTWLEDKHRIWISVLCDCGNEKLFTFKIYSTEPGEEKCLFNSENYNIPTEAYLTAIEYTLKQLL